MSNSSDSFRPIRGERTKELLQRLANTIDADGVDVIECATYLKVA